MVSDTGYLCEAAAVQEGASKAVHGVGLPAAGAAPIFLVRHRGRLLGYLDSCPHIPGSPLAWRQDHYLRADRQRIVCHAHGAQFDIDTGRCVLGPCLGQSLTAVPLRLADNGAVYLAGNNSKL